MEQTLRFSKKKLDSICHIIDGMKFEDVYSKQHTLSIDFKETNDFKPLYKFHQNGIFIFDINRIEIKKTTDWKSDERYIDLIIWEQPYNRSHNIKEYKSFRLTELQLEYINRSLTINTL